MFARKTTKKKKKDYIQNGYLVWILQSRHPAPWLYLRFRRTVYMRLLTKVKAKATQARMNE